VLNISEGRSRTGAARRNYYRIALASAAETFSALELLPLAGTDAQQAKLRRVGAMLTQMSK